MKLEHDKSIWEAKIDELSRGMDKLKEKGLI
jgi:hypothetical protein